jgi:hypothetical protein
MKLKPTNSPLVAFFTGPVGSGKDSIIGLLQKNLPQEGTTALLMTPVIDKLCEDNFVFREMRDKGERLPASNVAFGFKSMLLNATLDEQILRILCGGACRDVLEVRAYFDTLVNRRQNHSIHYFSFKCPRHICVERDHGRAKDDIAKGIRPRSDWGADTAAKRWDEHVEFEPSILSAVSQYPNVQIHEIDATQSKLTVLQEVWRCLSFGSVKETHELAL